MPTLNRRNILYLAFFASLISAVVMIALFIFLKPRESAVPKLTDKLKSFELKEEQKEDTDMGLLILGYGGAGHSGGGLADANILVYIDSSTKKLSMISVPRDIWISLPLRSDQSQSFKINHAFAIGNDDAGYPYKEPLFVGKDGGGELAKHAVAQVTGLPIDYYMAIDFSRFVAAIDALGGITVDVPVSFTDHYYPIPGNEELLCGFSPEKNAQINETYSGFELEKQFECRYETLEFSKGSTQMDGTTALKFIRSRHSSEHGGDFARGERTLAILNAIGKKLLSLGGLSRIDDFWEEYSHMVTTDIKEEDILTFLKKYSDASDYRRNTIGINDNLLTGTTSSDGQSILIPRAGDQNFLNIHTFIQQKLSQ